MLIVKDDEGGRISRGVEARLVSWPVAQLLDKEARLADRGS